MNLSIYEVSLLDDLHRPYLANESSEILQAIVVVLLELTNINFGGSNVKKGYSQILPLFEVCKDVLRLVTLFRSIFVGESAPSDHFYDVPSHHFILLLDFYSVLPLLFQALVKHARSLGLLDNRYLEPLSYEYA